MGLIFNRRKRIGRGRTLNVSKRGASVSQRAGRVTVNTRGRGSRQDRQGPAVPLQALAT